MTERTPDPTLIEQVANAIWREDHYDPKLCSHGGDGGTSCVYCEPHDDDTPGDWPADKERAERQAHAAIAAYEATLQGSAALPSDADDRLGPPELYGAVGVAMFKADLGGLRIDQKINFVGNAVYTAMRATTPTAPKYDTGDIIEAGLDASDEAEFGQ